jgi:polysaccharide transporter, PST family
MTIGENIACDDRRDGRQPSRNGREIFPDGRQIGRDGLGAFRERTATGPLWRQFARSVRNNVLAEVAVQGLRVSGMIVLARVLRPADFGVFRVLLVVGLFASVGNEAGVPDALIQRKDLRPEHQSTAWWISLAVALATTGILCAAAIPIARIMAMPELAGGIRLICLPILLEGTAVTANARLRRQLNFGALAAADVTAEIAFMAAALILLWRGLLVWSLPGGLAARFAVHAAAVWLADPHPPLGRPRADAARDLSGFASKVVGGRLLYVLSSNVDYLLVGQLLGSSALGFYALAWDLLRFVPDRLYRVAGRVALPTFCHLQEDDRALSRAYSDFVAYAARIVLPIVVCVVVAAPELIGTIYGERWIATAPALRLLSVGLAAAGLRIGIGSVYYAKGRPSLDIYLHGLRVSLIVAAVTLLYPMGLYAVSAGMSAVELLISGIGQWFACDLIKLRPSRLARATLPGLRVALLCGAATFAGKLAAEACHLSGPAVLLPIAAPPAALFSWLEGSDARQMISMAFERRSATRAAATVEQPT